uniref:uncharacterized protein LOC143393126 isoform X2 n=1 Tax=Callospermophilus lateralis TaxID=76772 RepID=UPI004038ECBC
MVDPSIRRAGPYRGLLVRAAVTSPSHSDTLYPRSPVALSLPSRWDDKLCQPESPPSTFTPISSGGPRSQNAGAVREGASEPRHRLHLAATGGGSPTAVPGHPPSPALPSPQKTSRRLGRLYLGSRPSGPECQPFRAGIPARALPGGRDAGPPPPAPPSRSPPPAVDLPCRESAPRGRPAAGPCRPGPGACRGIVSRGNFWGPIAAALHTHPLPDTGNLAWPSPVSPRPFSRKPSRTSSQVLQRSNSVSAQMTLLKLWHHSGPGVPGARLPDAASLNPPVNITREEKQAPRDEILSKQVSLSASPTNHAPPIEDGSVLLSPSTLVK